MYYNKHTNRNVSLFHTSDLAYILGVCLGDGSVYKLKCSFYSKNKFSYKYEVCLMAKDKEFVLSFFKALKNTGFNPFMKFKNNNKLWNVKATSVKFHNWYKSLSIDDIEKIVSNRTNLSREALTREFIRGFYESEGCFYTPMHHITLSNSNKSILLLIQKLLKDYSYNSSLMTTKPSNPKRKVMYSLYILGNKEKKQKFINWINPCIKRGEIRRDFSRKEKKCFCCSNKDPNYCYINTLCWRCNHFVYMHKDWTKEMLKKHFDERTCLNCGTKLSSTSKIFRKFCCRKCGITYRSQKGVVNGE